MLLKPSAAFVEKLGIDDAVGAVTVHGTLGLWGVLSVGIFATGYPALSGEDVATTSFIGQALGALVMVLCGFIPGYVISLAMKMMGVLRVGEAAEIAGLDLTKVPIAAYPEGFEPTARPGS